MLHQIGVGALGPVFRTYEPERDRLVAVKAFRLDITPEQAQSLADELSRAAEAGLFHPSVVEPIAAGIEGTVAYCAEEYVAAESLDVAMRHYAPAPIATVLPFITQLAGAIDFARAAGVGHGALHPRDIFVTPEEARATGFGVVEALERVGLRAPVRRPYSPPERIAGRSWTTSADVFSLAAITYELLTARRPSGLGREIGTLTAGTPNAYMDSLHAVLARAMDPEPSARYPTALAFAAALEAAARGESSDVAPADIAVERDEDEADHRLRLQDSDDTVPGVPAAQLDEDIEAEAEADRFAGDDFLLDAAGAASVAPDQPFDAPVRDLPINAGASDRTAGVRALEDDEVTVDRRPSPPFQPRDLTSDETIRRGLPVSDTASEPAVYPPTSAGGGLNRFPHEDADADTIRRPRPAPAPEFRPSPAVASTLSYEEPAAPRRSPVALVAMFVAGIAIGVLGAYALWGRAPQAPASSPGAAATSGSAAPSAPQAASREFSEQAVTPPAAPKATDTSAAARSAGSTPAAAPPDRGSRPADREPPTAAKPAPAPSSGTLVVRSTPSGASVTVNGQWRGRTPLTLNRLTFRRYDVRVVQPGYASANEAVALSAEAPTRALSLRLQPEAAARDTGPAAPRGTTTPPKPSSAAPEREPSQSPTLFTGSIYVDSRPRGARVSIDGKPVGVTPLRVDEVKIGTHVVRLELPDHRLWSTTARVTAGQEQRVTGSLERIQ